MEPTIQVANHPSAVALPCIHIRFTSGWYAIEGEGNGKQFLLGCPRCERPPERGESFIDTS